MSLLICISIHFCCLMWYYFRCLRHTLYFADNAVCCSVFVVLLCINLLVVYLYERHLKDERRRPAEKPSQLNYTADAEYVKRLEEGYQEHRVLIHDIKHHLTLIRCMAQDDNLTGITEYIDSIQNTTCMGRIEPFSGNRVADIVLSQKARLCKNSGVKLELEYNNPDLSFLSDADLCAMLSNTLDNAIEAATQSQEKNVQVRMYSSENRCFCFIEAINSCDKKPHKLAMGYKSTKSGDGHGVGLYSIRRTARKYGGQLVTEYTEDKKFRTTIMLQCQKL